MDLVADVLLFICCSMLLLYAIVGVFFSVGIIVILVGLAFMLLYHVIKTKFLSSEDECLGPLV